MPTNTDEITIACDLLALMNDQRDPHMIVSRDLFASVFEVHELTDGYALHLRDEVQTLHGMANFINDDRLCCPFIAFGMDVEPQQGHPHTDTMGEALVYMSTKSSFDLSNEPFMCL